MASVGIRDVILPGEMKLTFAPYRDYPDYFVSSWPFAGETSFDGGEGNDTFRLDRDPEGNRDDRLWSNWEQVVNVLETVTLPEDPIVSPIDPIFFVNSSPADAVNALAADLYHELARAAKWAHQFDVDATQRDRFTVSADEEIQVDMMHDTATYHYLEHDGVQYVELPYRDGRFSMILALPGESTPLSEVDVVAVTGGLGEFRSGLELQRVAVGLPKFEVNSMPDVKQALIDLGIEDLFDRDLSDLDGMKDPHYVLDGNLFVQDIRHKAFIELDEAGTTAAAATAVSVGYTSSVPLQPVTFTADHPFQYYICDTQTDTILFMGHVNRPIEAD
ncbi:MAG: serpin family protein [Thermoguttaceae bacterium]